MNARRRIYLDHAATSWPKSDEVLDAMNRFARQCGAAAGRGGYQSAAQADQIVSMTRRSIATLIGAESAECISFHANGTAALNAAIHGLLRSGDHVVTTAAEHNSVLRPLYHLEQQQRITLTVIPVSDAGQVDAGRVLEAVTPRTRLVAMTHASNVTGAIQPVAEVGQRLKDTPVVFLCDAAQTFGMLPIDVGQWGIDALAAPGHKGSRGPLGTGFLYAAERLHSQLVPIMQGGTGSQSESLEMPTTLPSMLEAGNLNVPALAGWLEALRKLQAADFDAGIETMQQLAERLYVGLAATPHLRIFGCPGLLPIASVAIDGLSPVDTAAILDAEYGIETRAGLHCAARIHAHLGSSPEGTLRISGGHTTTAYEVDQVIESLRELVTTLHGN